MQANNQLLDRNQAAAFLNIQPQTLAVWASCKRYDLPYIKIGRRAMYSPVDLIAFIGRNRVGGGVQ